MSHECRRTGLGFFGDVPWGTHACLFYDQPQNLISILAQFIAKGLQENEACLWVISEPLSVSESLALLRPFVPELHQYLAERRLEIVSRTEWYTDVTAAHDGDHLRCFRAKLDSALDRGFAGLRATGDAARLGQRYKQLAAAYEKALHSFLTDRPALVLCSYPLEGTSASELLDASRSHSLTAIVREGKVQLLDTPHPQGDKANGNRPAADPIRLLRAENDQLIKEITERKTVEEELRKQKEILQTIFDHIPVMINFFKDDRFILVNREWEQILGWTLDEIKQRRINIMTECYPDAAEQKRVQDYVLNSTGEWGDFKTRVRDGRVIDTSWAVVHLSDGTHLGIGRDITELKKAEARLQASTEQLRSLSASIQEAREEERTRVARAVHDELGAVLSSLKWDLSGLDQLFPEPPDPAVLAALRLKIGEMLKLVDSTIESVRSIASELRPRILDDLGLVDAIEWQTQRFEARTGIICRRHGFSDHLALSTQQSTAIFRIFQESLTNILRHAEATRVDITMARENADFSLTIQDNGRGIIGVEKSGLGILGMQERARLIGGTIEIRGSEGEGTAISVRVPISDHRSIE